MSDINSAPPEVTITVHDDVPVIAGGIVNDGLGLSNDATAPLHEVQPLSCFALSEGGTVLGGAIGRRWGECCELQQLWVLPAYRHRGIATRLLEAFEAGANTHGCRDFFLETFSFQAPDFYRARGYAVAHENTLFPHGIVKTLMVKRLC